MKQSKRITCARCHKRRIPWYAKLRGDSVILYYVGTFFSGEFKTRMRPLICFTCYHEMEVAVLETLKQFNRRLPIEGFPKEEHILHRKVPANKKEEPR